MSCVARLETDAVITVPPKRVKEKAVGETVLTRSPPLAFEWPPPFVRKVKVQMDPLTLEKTTPT